MWHKCLAEAVQLLISEPAQFFSTLLYDCIKTISYQTLWTTVVSTNVVAENLNWPW